MLPDSKLFMEMLKNKDKVLVSILKDIDTSEKNMQSFNKLDSLYQEGNPVKTDSVLKACAKSLKHINDINRKMLMLLMVYVAGNNYTSDTAHVLMKLGKGQEALQEMWKQKING